MRRSVGKLSTALYGLSLWMAASCVGLGQGAAVPTAPRTSELIASVPLPSLDALSFLEGSWTAESRDGKTKLGTYTWVRELNGHILARHGAAAERAEAAAECAEKVSPVCDHNDMLYVYQDSAGAPLSAIFFDNEGHVIHYDVTTRHDAAVSEKNTRDFATFLSDAAALGPRFRLTYERNTDTQTNRTSLSGRFEILLPNGQWRPCLEWFGRKL